MLEHDSIDVSDGIHVNKTDGLSERIICYYWYFLQINFKFQTEVCSGCHDLMQKVISFNDAAFVSANGNDYRIHFWYTSKDKAINLLRNANLTDKIGTI